MEDWTAQNDATAVEPQAEAEDAVADCDQAAYIDKEGPPDPSVYDEMLALGKQIEIAKQEGTKAKETYRRLGRVVAENYPQAWTMPWHNPGEKFCVPKGARDELKINKHKIVPSRMRPDNHSELYDELRAWRRTGPKGSKAYSYEEGFKWPLDSEFDPIEKLARKTVYKQDSEEDESQQGQDTAQGDEAFQGNGEGGLSAGEDESQFASLPPSEEEEEEVDYEPEEEEEEEEEDQGGSSEGESAPRRATKKRQHSPSPHISHKHMQATHARQFGEGIDLAAMMEEEALEEFAPDQQMATDEDSDDDDKPYPSGLYYLCKEEWVKIDHSCVKKISTGIPNNIMRYVAIQQSSNQTGLQSISTLGPVFNNMGVEMETPNEDGEVCPHHIHIRCGDLLWDEKHPRMYYAVVSTAADLDLECDEFRIPSSQDLIVHSAQGTFSNRHKWSFKKASRKSELVGVGKFSEYTHYRPTNIYLGPTVRVSNDKQLYEQLNKELRGCTCLHHYRELFDLMKQDPVKDILDFHMAHSPDQKANIAFTIAATDCATKVRTNIACILFVSCSHHTCLAGRGGL